MAISDLIKKKSAAEQKTTLIIVDVDKTQSINVNTRLLNSFRPIVIAIAITLVCCLAIIIVLTGINLNKSIQVKRANTDKAEAQKAAQALEIEVQDIQNQTSEELQNKISALEASETTVNSLQTYLQDRGVSTPTIIPLEDAKQLSHSEQVESNAEEDISEQEESESASVADNDSDRLHQGGPVVTTFEDVTYLTNYAKQIEALSLIARQVPIGLPHPGALSSRFGRRSNPFTGRSAEFHHGLDFKGKTGSPIRTTADGVVITAGRLGGYGLAVKVKHGYGYVTVYGHLSAVDVKVGQTVKAGDVIGKLGSTGRSTGPHLHYEVRQGNLFLNPESFISLNSPAPKTKKVS